MKDEQSQFLKDMKNMKELRDEARRMMTEKDSCRLHKTPDSTFQKEHEERLAFLGRMKKMKELRDLARKTMTGK